ncbi:MAG TPA: choice-of-anchor G family protein, partial [Microbacteriaceae bacterium]|nr:choice-of-anchor G family protein [Microbacteriaceae bacterium]
MKKYSQKRMKTGAKGLAYFTVAAMVVTPGLIFAASASADEIPTTAPAAAHGHGLYLPALNLGVAGAAYANSNNDNDPGLNKDAINVSVLESLEVDLGTVTLPLIKTATQSNGLLNLGSLGALESSAHSPQSHSAYSASGLLGSDGALALDAYNDASLEPASVDLSSLLAQILGQSTVDTVIDTAELSIGALGAEVEATGSTLDPTKVEHKYVLADLGLDLHSNLVDDLVDSTDAIVSDVVQPIQSLLDDGGAIEVLVAGVVSTIGALPLVNASLNELSIDTQPLTAAIQDQFLNSSVSNEEGSIVIDLEDGLIHIDLAQIVVDSTGSADLNSLPANTEVLDSATIALIVEGVEEALLGSSANSLVTKLTSVINEYIYHVELNVDIEADISIDANLPLVPPVHLVTAPVTVTGSLGGFLGQSGHDDPVVDTSQINVLLIPVGTVLQPIVDTLTGLVSNIGGALAPAVNTVLAESSTTLTNTLTPVVTPLLDTLSPLLNGLVQIRINEQPSVAPLNTDADLGAASFTVRALSLNLLPLIDEAKSGNVALQLGSATTLAEDEEDPDPGADATSTADADATSTADTDATSTSTADADVNASASASASA